MGFFFFEGVRVVFHFFVGVSFVVFFIFPFYQKGYQFTTAKFFRK